MPETVPAGDSRGVSTSPEPGLDDTPETRSDPELIAATRSGDTTAYAVLYERHVHSARRLARILSRDPAGADDLVSEAFAKLLHTFREGGGPDLAFRPYMLQTLRNNFYDRLRRDKKVEFTDDLTEHDSGEIYVDPAVEGQERRYAALAFGKLPERWRMVLWHTEVEEDSPAKIATMLGMTPNGVSALAYRAREKLRQNYLSEHAADSPREECRWTVDRIGARVRGKLGERDVSKVDDHLDSCVTCNLLYAELTELNSGLRGVVAGVLLGAAAGPYIAAGVVSAAGLAFGGAFAVIFMPFKAVANWIRRIVQRLGTKGTAATGTAVAVAAAVAVFALTSGEEEQEPQSVPDESVVEPADPGEEPAEPGPMPPDPDPDPQDPAEPEPAPGEEPANPADPAEPASYGIAHGLGSTGLVAGEEAILPIRLQAPGSAGGGYAPVFEREAESVAALGNADADGPVGREAEAPGGAGYAPVVERDAESVAALGNADALERDAAAPGDYAPAPERFLESTTTEPTAAERRGQGASDRVTLDITMPSGITLASETADPGWACTEAEAVVHCTIAAMPDPAEANVRIRIGEEVSGYQTFEVAVEGPGISGTTALQVPIAPAGSEVGYASVAATGITAAGNTWLTCAVPGCHEVVAHRRRRPLADEGLQARHRARRTRGRRRFGRGPGDPRRRRDRMGGPVLGRRRRRPPVGGLARRARRFLDRPQRRLHARHPSRRAGVRRGHGPRLKRRRVLGRHRQPSVADLCLPPRADRRRSRTASSRTGPAGRSRSSTPNRAPRPGRSPSTTALPLRTPRSRSRTAARSTSPRRCGAVRATSTATASPRADRASASPPRAGREGPSRTRTGTRSGST